MRKRQPLHLSKLTLFFAAYIFSLCLPLATVQAEKHKGAPDLRAPVPATAKEAVRQAVELADSDHLKESVAELRKAISIAPHYLAAHVQYIRIKTFYLDRYDEVRREYDRLMQRQPNNAVYPMALAMAAAPLVPERVKREWFEKVSRLAPDWAWSHYAKAKLVSEQDPQAAAAELLEFLEQEGTATEPYEMLISLQKNKLAKIDDALKTAERMYAQPETSAPGLYHLSSLRLAKAGRAEQSRAAVRDELDRLSASSLDAKILAAIRDVYADVLYDRERTLKVENRLRQIDPGWYPERGWTFVLPTANGEGVPTQIPMSGHRVTVLFKAYFIGDDLEANVKTARLEQLLGESTDPGVRWYIYNRLFNIAEKSNDHAAVVKYGEALRAIDSSSGVAWLAKIALALAEEKKDLTKALKYARLADDKTAQLHSAVKPLNTDADWFKEAATPDWQKQNYQEQRALALDAHGWVLSRMGDSSAAEVKLRESLKISRSEKKLLHLAEALRQLGRTDEAEKVVTEARNEYAESIKRKFVNETAKDFELEATDGRKVKLSDLRGKPVMLYFLATWCAACSKEGPYLVKFYEKYKPSGLEILAISIDEAADRHKVAPLAKELNYTFPVLLDEGVAKTYNVQGVPMSMIFIDRKGNVRYRQKGFFEETPRDLDIVVQELLK